MDQNKDQWSATRKEGSINKDGKYEESVVFEKKGKTKNPSTLRPSIRSIGPKEKMKASN